MRGGVIFFKYISIRLCSILLSGSRDPYGLGCILPPISTHYLPGEERKLGSPGSHNISNGSWQGGAMNPLARSEHTDPRIHPPGLAQCCELKAGWRGSGRQRRSQVVWLLVPPLPAAASKGAGHTASGCQAEGGVPQAAPSCPATPQLSPAHTLSRAAPAPCRSSPHVSLLQRGLSPHEGPGHQGVRQKEGAQGGQSPGQAWQPLLSALRRTGQRRSCFFHHTM